VSDAVAASSPDPRISPRRGIHVPAGDGVTRWFDGGVTTVKLRAASTHGTLGLTEASIPPGAGPGPNAHVDADETFYVLSGDIEMLDGDARFRAGPWDTVHVPRGVRHGFKNVGLHPARLLILFTPGGVEARALAEGATGHLRLSYVVTVLGGLAERVVREYQRRYPGVGITAAAGTTEQNVARLRGGELDVAYVHTPLEDADGIAWVDIAAQPLVVALPSAHPLSRRRRVRREKLAGVPLVHFPRHQSPGVYDRGLEQVYGADQPEIVRTEPTAERTLVAVAEGAGAGLPVAEQAAALRRPGLTFRRFADPEPTVPLAVAFHQRPPLPARRFVELARELAR
jgi:DNA-binding transcriptional LysR family regulator/mannose-6-phosphate isomerase-like protein (cupin superfamily)